MCEELLDILPQSGSRAFDLFCDALKADGQEEIVTLYLKPSQPELEVRSEQRDSCVQESGSQTGAKQPQSETRVCTSKGMSVSDSSFPKEDNGSMIVPDSGIGCDRVSFRHRQNLSHPVTVHEEFQHVRRYIEPVQPRESSPNTLTDLGAGQKDPETRFLYQSLPDGQKALSPEVYSLITDSSYSRSEKEKILLSMGLRLPVNELMQAYKDYGSRLDPHREFIHSKYDNLLYQDSFAGREKGNIDLPLTMHQRNAEPPNVFNVSPQMPNIPPRNLSQPVGQFIFRSKDQIQNSSLLDNGVLQNTSSDRSVGRENEFYLKEKETAEAARADELETSSYLNIAITEKCQQRNLTEDRHFTEANEKTLVQKNQFNKALDSGFIQNQGSYKNIQHSMPSPMQQSERDFFEISRHVEINSSKSNGRFLVSFPRYIEKELPVGFHPDGKAEEFVSGQATPRLTRNDSVGGYS